MTAIVGTSGSGKSTLARVLSKQLLVDEQKVFYGTADIAALSSSILAKHVGFVDAHSYIFTGTIADNLRLANPQATIEMMMQALTAARLHGFVQNSKEGLDTFVGESGSELSGGQKQRLALARMILADRDVYIFDEATSNIDVESEEAIWDAIYELGRLKTVIVITHRLANVKTANMIHVLEHGELVESGTHETLLTKNGQYAELVLQQEQLEKIREVRK